MRAPTTPVLPGEGASSPKSYATAVILSSVFGFLGVQHFYLGRWGHGWIDVGLSAGWILSLLAGEIQLAVVLGLADFGHAFWVTIQLFTGNCRDGEGRVVCYPGQKLKETREVCSTWKPS